MKMEILKGLGFMIAAMALLYIIGLGFFYKYWGIWGAIIMYIVACLWVLIGAVKIIIATDKYTDKYM